ncbi:MAG: hypothetical protein ACP5HQ_05465 [Thermoprotei archaeon]|jgi:hypothetical protein
MKERIVEARRIVGKKTVNGKVYEYDYYTLPLNLYIPKSVIERYGTRFVVRFDEVSGTITILPQSEEKS